MAARKEVGVNPKIQGEFTLLRIPQEKFPPPPALFTPPGQGMVRYPDQEINIILAPFAYPACPVAPADGTGVGPEDRTGAAWRFKISYWGRFNWGDNHQSLWPTLRQNDLVASFWRI